MTTAAPVALRSLSSSTLGFLIVLPLLLSFAAPVANAYAGNPSRGHAQDVWSDDYINMIFPWAPANDDILSSSNTTPPPREVKSRLAEDNPDIFEYHEGMNGGTNARGGMTADAYEGWYYGHSSPWMIRRTCRAAITTPSL